MATDAITRRYDMLRQRAVGQAQAQGQEEDDALKRRMAAQGGLQSGTYVKQQMMAKDRSAQRQQAAREGIDVQEMAERAGLEEAERQRAWGTGERVAGQTWQSGERVAGQTWQSGERVAGQTWQSGEAQKGRQFSTSEREAGQTWQSGERQQAQGYDWQKFQTQLAETMRQFNIGHEMDEQMMELNRQIAQYSMPDKTPYWQKKETWTDWFGGADQGLGGAKNAVGSWF